MSESSKKNLKIQNIVFGVILILLFGIVCRLFAPFFTTLLWSILLYIIIKPLHQKCIASFDRTTMKGKIYCNVIALVFSFSTAILILFLLSFVVFQLFKQVTEMIRQALDYSVSHSLSYNNVLEDISRLIREFSSGQIVISAGEISSQIQGFLQSGLQSLIRLSRNAAGNIAGFFLGLISMLFCLFFFFMDGSYLARLALRVIPIRKEYINALVIKFKEISRKLVLGYIIVALAEAVAAFIIFSLFGVHGTLVFATLVFFSAFIPMVGPSLIWFPLGILRIINGNLTGGLALMLVSAAFISSIDTFLRPLLLKDRIQLHPLIIFFAILGGISAFGFNGLILGPMAVIIFLTVFDLFLIEHKLEQD